MSAVTFSDIEEKIIPSFCATLDYIPLVSNVAGAVRGVFGSIQIAVGVLLSPVEIISRVRENQFSFIAIQGIANLVRAVVAQKPIVGNIVLYLYDHNRHMKYEFQKACRIIP